MACACNGKANAATGARGFWPRARPATQNAFNPFATRGFPFAMTGAPPAPWTARVECHPAPGTAPYVGSGCAIYGTASPGVGTPVKTTLTNGTTVTVVDHRPGAFSRVLYPGGDGWLASAALIGTIQQASRTNVPFSVVQPPGGRSLGELERRRQGAILEAQRAQIQDYTETTSTPVSMPVLRLGSTDRENVIALQKRLVAAGYDHVTVDGDFGPQTENAVGEFQSSQGLSPTGVVDAVTWERLTVAAGSAAATGHWDTSLRDVFRTIRQQFGDQTSTVTAQCKARFCPIWAPDRSRLLGYIRQGEVFTVAEAASDGTVVYVTLSNGVQGWVRPEHVRIGGQ